jgi:hypothetical protein
MASYNFVEQLIISGWTAQILKMFTPPVFMNSVVMSAQAYFCSPDLYTKSSFSTQKLTEYALSCSFTEVSGLHQM